MGILNKIRLLIFKDERKNSGFDLKELKENLRRFKERESERKRTIYSKTDDTPLIIDPVDYEIIREVNAVPDPLIAYGRTGEFRNDTLRVRNPLLLGVKMFLADVIYMVNMPYDYDRHNCSNFSKDVQDAATKHGIRCGLVTISFHKSRIGHAIVAFETDYGLKFFEPQSATEEDVIIGHRYSADLSEISNDNIIIKIEISWNDGTHTTIE